MMYDATTINYLNQSLLVLPGYQPAAHFVASSSPPAAAAAAAAAISATVGSGRRRFLCLSAFFGLFRHGQSRTAQAGTLRYSGSAIAGTGVQRSACASYFSTDVSSCPPIACSSPKRTARAWRRRAVVIGALDRSHALVAGSNTSTVVSLTLFQPPVTHSRPPSTVTARAER